MGALLDRFQASGIAFRALPDGRLHAIGPISDATRAAIREHKAAILTELAANDGAPVPARPAQTSELRELVAIIFADDSEADRAEALAVAMADADAALVSFRSLAQERGLPISSATPADPRMRMCADCANLTREGRCLAAWRGESFSAGITIARDYRPAMTDRPQRCAPFKPLPGDPDPRTGAERWPWLLSDAKRTDQPSDPGLAKGFR